MTDDELLYASIETVRELLDRKELTSEELTRRCLDRAASTAALNAFITLRSERALEEARSSDERRRRGEKPRALEGIPITVKDLVWSRGDRCTSGSKLNADFVPDRDAPCLASLRGAGAVLLGKTNLHEFAYGVSNVNPHYGPARNPWDRDRISGGSSGGSAVALASGIGYGSIGTDTGGSIRIPSSLCGTVGLKPSYGRISRDGVTPLSWSLDHVGPMARSVADVRTLYGVLIGKETSEADPDESSTPLRGLRLGLHRRYFFERLSAEVNQAVSEAIARLESLGAEPRELDIPEIDLQGACRNTIAFAEASSYHEPNIRERPDEYGADTRELLRLGLLIPATEYLTAVRARRRIVRAFREAFAKIDVLITPATPSPAPPIGAPALDNGEELRSGLLRHPSPFNTTGFPAVALPCGATTDGLPVGLQIAAGPGGESLLVRVAEAFERASVDLDWSRRRPAI